MSQYDPRPKYKPYLMVIVSYTNPEARMLNLATSHRRERSAPTAQHRRHARLWRPRQQRQMVGGNRFDRFDDSVLTSYSWDPIVRYIKDQHSAYLRKELTAQRERYIQDTRVHCCLFFIQPSGHAYVYVSLVATKAILYSATNVLQAQAH